MNLFKQFVADSSDGDKWIVMLILLLSDKKLQKIKCWKSFSEDFFNTYKTRIFAFCGYGEPDVPAFEKIRIPKTYCMLFLVCLGELKRDGVFSECSYEKLADLIDLLFETGHTKMTVLNKLKEEDTDFYKLADRIQEEKKRINSKKETSNN